MEQEIDISALPKLPEPVVIYDAPKAVIWIGFPLKPGVQWEDVKLFFSGGKAFEIFQHFKHWFNGVQGAAAIQAQLSSGKPFPPIQGKPGGLFSRVLRR